MIKTCVTLNEGQGQYNQHVMHAHVSSPPELHGFEVRLDDGPDMLPLVVKEWAGFEQLF